MAQILQQGVTIFRNQNYLYFSTVHHLSICTNLEELLPVKGKLSVSPISQDFPFTLQVKAINNYSFGHHSTLTLPPLIQIYWILIAPAPWGYHATPAEFPEFSVKHRSQEGAKGPKVTPMESRFICLRGFSLPYCSNIITWKVQRIFQIFLEKVVAYFRTQQSTEYYHFLDNHIFCSLHLFSPQLVIQNSAFCLPQALPAY